MKAIMIAIPEKALENIGAKASEFDVTVKESGRYSSEEGVMALDLLGPDLGINKFISWYQV